MTTEQLKAPFRYFGGKSKAAPKVWEAMGDVGGYVEPFAGSAAVLLARPSFTGRRVETLNDMDGWLVNAWRAIKHSPDEVAKHAAGPVIEIDYHAKKAWLQERRNDDLIAWLGGHPEQHDAKAAAWWLYVLACGIGDPWGKGPWTQENGVLERTGKPHGIQRAIPALGNAGTGIHSERAQNLPAYMRALSKRLETVRIANGDWKRVLTPSAIRATATNPVIGVFLDPPYETSGDLYATTNETSGDTGEHKTISSEVRDWALANGEKHRVVICGYDTEHDSLLAHGWTKQKGRAGGSGYKTDASGNEFEQLWMSPTCLTSQNTLDLGF